MDLEITLSNLLPLLTYPLNLALWLIIVAALCAWLGRRVLAGLCVGISFAVLWLCATPVFAGHLMSQLERRYAPVPVIESPQSDAIVVLGGGIGLANPPRLEPHLNASSDRILHAARLYRAGKAPVVITSGGNTFPQRVGEPESIYAAAILEEFGVDKNAILLEIDSRNTYENALATKRLLQQHKLSEVLLVTSARHMPRALATFRSAGINAIPSPTDYRIARYDRPGIFKWLPTAGALGTTTVALKEYLGMAVYRWRGWINPT